MQQISAMRPNIHQDPGKTVELREGPLDGLRIRVASGINGSWLPTQSGTAVLLVEYYKSSAANEEGQEVWLYRPSLR
jgi:hypothetical protein